MRPAFDALFGIDDAMADVVMKTTQPTLGAIKLAWWRERLEELDEGQVPAEPRLQAAAAALLPRGITGNELAGLESGWAETLVENPDAAKALERGAKLFVFASRLLGGRADVLDRAGRIFAAGDYRRRGIRLESVVIPDLPVVPRKFRPLTSLTILALRDLRRASIEPEATPARAWSLLRHRITGRP